MKRDLQKYIDEYNRKYLNEEDKTQKGKLYASDLQQIMEITGNPKMNRDAYLVWNALQAGFMIGYKAAKHDARRRAR